MRRRKFVSISTMLGISSIIGTSKSLFAARYNINASFKSLGIYGCEDFFGRSTISSLVINQPTLHSEILSHLAAADYSLVKSEVLDYGEGNLFFLIEHNTTKLPGALFVLNQHDNNKFILLDNAKFTTFTDVIDCVHASFKRMGNYSNTIESFLPYSNVLRDVNSKWDISYNNVFGKQICFYSRKGNCLMKV